MRLNSQFWFLGDVYGVVREVNLALQNSGMNLGKQERSALVVKSSRKYATP
ncbi:MAG: hypothetical protein V7K18_23620 [Nostoc sp.]|uniref:hypothetical protein n=1 Tax=Nostoc sp. TaxID=1180 RepID=UPI002FFA2321